MKIKFCPNESAINEEGGLVERMQSAAIRCGSGVVFEHDTHYDAIWDAFWAGAFPPMFQGQEEEAAWFAEISDSAELANVFGIERGFLSTTGRFLSREEAYALARQSGQVFHRYVINEAVGLDAAVLSDSSPT